MRLRQDLRRAAQARHRGGHHDHQDLAATTRPRPGAQTLRAHLDAVPTVTGRGDRGLRFLHGGDDLAQDAVRAVLHPPQHQASHPRRSYGQPRLGMGHPAGQERRDGPERSGTVDQIRASRPRHQVHSSVRRRLPQRERGSPPNPNPGSKGKRLCRAVVRTVRAECLDWTLVLGRRHRCDSCAPTSATTTSSDRTAAWHWPFLRRRNRTRARCPSGPKTSSAATCSATSSTSITRSQHDEPGFPRPTRQPRSWSGRSTGSASWTRGGCAPGSMSGSRHRPFSVRRDVASALVVHNPADPSGATAH
jgi:hypothetical protein